MWCNPVTVQLLLHFSWGVYWTLMLRSCRHDRPCSISSGSRVYRLQLHHGRGIPDHLFFSGCSVSIWLQHQPPWHRSFVRITKFTFKVLSYYTYNLEFLLLKTHLNLQWNGSCVCRYAGILLSITNTFATIPGMVGPIIARDLTKHVRNSFY